MADTTTAAPAATPTGATGGASAIGIDWNGIANSAASVVNTAFTQGFQYATVKELAAAANQQALYNQTTNLAAIGAQSTGYFGNALANVSGAYASRYGSKGLFGSLNPFQNNTIVYAALAAAALLALALVFKRK